MTSRACPVLILLVGSNPLPNYLAAMLLAPRAVRLVYTPETEPTMERLKAALRDHVEDVEASCVPPAEPSRIRDAVRDVPLNAHLNYTGGTKVMAAHARMAFREAGGSDRQASYVDEGAGVLRRDDGTETSLAGLPVPLTFESIAALHGCTLRSRASRDGSLPDARDAEIVLTAVLHDLGLAGRLYDEGQRLEKLGRPAHAVDTPFIAEGELAALSERSIPAVGWSDGRFKAWWRFLKGDWLELGVAHRIQERTGITPSQGIHCRLPSGRQFEVDVALVRGHRFFLVSCTTDKNLDRCKNKLFEVAMRSRQLGGDLARSALVCLIDGRDNRGPWVAQLRDDVESVWSAPNTPRVFGAADLREWAGVDGAADLRSLDEWLGS